MAVASVKATINGQQYTLVYDSTTQTYKATITAPNTTSYNNEGHYYPVTILATDAAGNTDSVNDLDATLGTACQLKVKEKVKPTIAVTVPAAGATITSNTPQIKWNVTDDGSGINSGTISIKIDSGSTITNGITKTPITNGFACTYTPSTLSDGAHTITLNVSDNDGNAATAVSSSFRVDTTPPALAVNTPVDNLITNVASQVVSGTTNDVTSSPVTLKVNGTTVTVAQDGSWSTTITLTEGTNTITVVATDAAGKSSTVTRSATLDTAPPVITGVTITPNPVDAGATYVISVTVTD